MQDSTGRYKISIYIFKKRIYMVFDNPDFSLVYPVFFVVLWFGRTYGRGGSVSF